MYNFKSCLSFINKIIVLLITISLLSVSVSFNFTENIKQELNTLYEATSVCEYYNAITNFSYGIINKILESTNISLTKKESQQNDTEKKDHKNNTQNTLYFVKSTNEKETNNLKFSNYYKFHLSDILLNKKIYFIFTLSKTVFKFHIFKLSNIKAVFCYFARGNIDSILNITNNRNIVRLV